jgi:hypothetical protein
MADYFADSTEVYLRSSDVINWDHPQIRVLASKLAEEWDHLPDIELGRLGSACEGN